MSKNKSENGAYNFDFIIKSLGLTTILQDAVALNVNAISDLQAHDNGGLTVYVQSGRSYDLDKDQTIKLEALLRKRIEIGKVDYEENAEFQMVAQHRAREKAERRILGVQGVIDTGNNRPPWRK